MRAFSIALFLSAFIALPVLADDEKESKKASISELIIKYAAQTRRVGESHPTAIDTLRNILRNIADGNNSLDKNALDAEFRHHYRDYHEYKQRFGLNHPVTQASLQTISTITRLLMARDVVTQKDLPQLVCTKAAIDEASKISPNPKP